MRPPTTAETIMRRSAIGSRALPSFVTWFRRLARYPSIQSVHPMMNMNHAAITTSSLTRRTHQKKPTPTSRMKEMMLGIVRIRSSPDRSLVTRAG